MSSTIHISAPLDDATLEKMKTGDRLLISGVMYTGRDMAHKRMVDALHRGDELPFDIRGQIIYFVGPTPARPGKAIGAAGPTTSYRMDAYAPELLKRGLKMTIGKGARSKEVCEAMIQYKALYCAATGGAAALLSKCITRAEVIAYDDLGPEAIRKLEVEQFPCVVINDIHGGDLYTEGRRQYAEV